MLCKFYALNLAKMLPEIMDIPILAILHITLKLLTVAASTMLKKAQKMGLW